MPPKAYVLLLDDAAGTVHIPVKAVDNRVTHLPVHFCPGCPAIFGGTIKRGMTWQQTIFNEVSEESVRTYRVVAPDAAQWMWSDSVNGDPYDYYTLRRVLPDGSTGWAGVPPAPPGATLPVPPPGSTYEVGEMRTIEAVDRAQIPRLSGVPLAQALVALTGATPTPAAFTTFVNSSTLRAFGFFANL